MVDADLIRTGGVLHGYAAVFDMQDIFSLGINIAEGVVAVCCQRKQLFDAVVDFDLYGLGGDAVVRNGFLGLKPVEGIEAESDYGKGG